MFTVVFLACRDNDSPFAIEASAATSPGRRCQISAVYRRKFCAFGGASGHRSDWLRDRNVIENSQGDELRRWYTEAR